jgi:ABC-2 type transport system permease protein
MKEDLKRRLWAVALISLGCFFLYPVSATFLAGSIAEAKNADIGIAIYTKELISILSFSSSLTMIGMVLTSLICGLSSFSYLNTKSKVDFYHGLPIRRERLYAANYLNGILFAAVPYGICLVLAVLIGLSNGVSSVRLIPAAAAGYVLHMIYYILMYTMAVIASILTGNLIVGFLGCGVFAFAIPLAIALVQGYFSVFFNTYSSVFDPWWYAWGIRLSPLMEYIHQIGCYESGEPVLAAAFAALVIAAVLAVTGAILYRKRPSEAAGKAMAFPVSEPVIRILLTIISALGMGCFFWEMRNAMGWAVFGLICGAVICHCVIETIYHFDFRKLFAHKLQLLGCVAAALAVFCTFRYDLIGYDRWVPESGQIRSAAVNVDTLNQWVSYGASEQSRNGAWNWNSELTRDHVLQTMQTTDVENVRELADAGVRWTQLLKQIGKNAYDNDAAVQIFCLMGADDGPTAVFLAGKLGDTVENDSDTGTENNWCELTICYTMNSGRKVYRKYNLCLESILPQIDRLMADPEYQKAAYPLMSRDAAQVAVIRYREGEAEQTLAELTQEEKTELLEAFQEEFRTLTVEQMYEEAPIGLIRFSSEADEQAMNWAKERERKLYSADMDYPEDEYSYDYYGYSWYSDLKDYDYYPVYPSFARTIALLQKHQVEPGEYDKNQEVQSVRISVYPDNGYWDGEWHNDHVEVTVTDPEEIRELQEITVDQNRLYYNPYYQSEDQEVILISTKNGATSERYVLFPKGKVPEFVEKRLEAQ